MHVSEEQTAALLDPDQFWLEGVEEVLTKIGVDVVGRSTDAAGALRLLADLRPDLLLTEMQPPTVVDANSYLREALALVPTLRVIVISASEDPSLVAAAFDSGATTYVIKPDEPRLVASAVAYAIAQLHVRAPAEGQQLDGDGLLQRESRTSPAHDEASSLTCRELEVLSLAERHSNMRTAKLLRVTEQTVRFQLSNVYRKLDASNRKEASRRARSHGLLPRVALAEKAGRQI